MIPVLPLLAHAELLTVFMFLGAFIGTLVSLILAFGSPVPRHANRLLSVSLFSVALFALTSALLINHAIFLVPHLFRVNMPLHYLVAPCAYLYVRAVLYQETRFRRFDWLFFVPFGLHTLELLPFLLHGAAYKVHYLQRLLVDVAGVAKQQEGLLPAYYHPVLKFGYGTACVVLQWRLLGQFSRRADRASRGENHRLLRWLRLFTLLNTLLYPPVLLAIVLPVSGTYATIFAVCVLGSYLLVTSTLLLFQPQVLYGLRPAPAAAAGAAEAPAPTAPAATKKADPARACLLSKERKQTYCALLKGHMQQQPFRRKGYSIKDLAAETGIPPHHVSALINQEYRMNFSDFLNRYRVEYIKARMGQLDWRHLTLEGLALEAGFSNRTTFFRAFVKLAGCTPTEYLAQITPSA
ncbi:AraC family transcriptional regulator [Hymenobacter psoromatis]|uniref:AraC family transcriptional regulator n=1 Tax=Hymenobacter psoromatis TaxID=1484116 RepID=UPI001CBE1C37|nr:helix-turn-helix domain-containing protein [Hymenobacter psoromatis]